MGTTLEGPTAADPCHFRSLHPTCRPKQLPSLGDGSPYAINFAVMESTNAAARPASAVDAHVDLRFEGFEPPSGQAQDALAVPLTSTVVLHRRRTWESVVHVAHDIDVQRTITVPHGQIRLPVFVPDATKAVVRGVLPDQLVAAGIETILISTAHLATTPGASVVHKLGGIHEFTGWEGPIIADSGGFQAFHFLRQRPRPGD